MQRTVAQSSVTYEMSMRPTVSFDFSIRLDSLDALLAKSKRSQWNAATDIDWSEVLDADNPLSLPASTFPMLKSTWFSCMRPDRQAEVVRDYQGWLVSQFLHGEQFGVLTSARIALEASDQSTKMFAAVQAVDEARHFEAYSELVRRIGVFYPLSEPFEEFLADVLVANELDIVHLGLQIIGEGIGLASFDQIRRSSTSPLVTHLYSRIMEDEARHVAFGRLHLADHYCKLTSGELRIREDFVIHSCELLQNRFEALEVWSKFGLEPDDAKALLKTSAAFRVHRRALMNHIIPIIGAIGLWSDRVRDAFSALGIGDAGCRAGAIHEN